MQASKGLELFAFELCLDLLDYITNSTPLTDHNWILKTN